MSISRRQAILRTLFGSTGLGLASFASGIPAALLANPRRALAAGAASATCPSPAGANYLIFSRSADGDPLNGNAPGTYDDPNIVHPAQPSMAPTPLALGGKQVKAAAPWAQLDAGTLARTSFFHHSTNTVVHADEPMTLALGNATTNNEMLVSLLASQLAPCLGTVQAQPVVVGGINGVENISYRNRVQPHLVPRALASVLTLPDGPLKNLRPLRDQTLDAINAALKAQGTRGQADFLDRYAKSQSELRSISDSLLNSLASIKDNGQESQIVASIALIQLNVTPVATLKFQFGGDNHGDTNLARESEQTASGCASIASLMKHLKDANLADKVTFLSSNVFGRTMSVDHKVQNGRDHNSMHHVSVMIGSRIKGGVVGGVMARNGDYSAAPIDSASGQMAQGGDISVADSFTSMGKTLGAAVGLTPEFLQANIRGGKVVSGALA